MYFVRGLLPWQGLDFSTKEEKYQLVLEQKQAISIAELCKDLPQEFETYLNYVRSLRYQDKPDYDYLRQIFRDLFYRNQFEYDNVYDWTIREFLRLGLDSTEGVEKEKEEIKSSREDGKELQGPTSDSPDEVENVG